MRIYFSALTLPKKAAKRLQAHFFPEWVKDKFPLADAQDLTARMLGYAHWHELHQVTRSGRHPASPLDEQATPEEQRRRVDFQTAVLATLSPLTDAARRQLALRLRVSAANPSSDLLAENAHCRNRLFYCEQFEEWRFFPSLRSAEASEELWALQDRWEDGELSFGELWRETADFRRRQPENVYLMWLLLRAAIEVDAPEGLEAHLPGYEQAIERCIPPNFPARANALLNWYQIRHRDFLRCVFMLAECFYRLGNWRMAWRWFRLSHRTSTVFRADVAPFLADLRRAQPTGLAHLMPEAP